MASKHILFDYLDRALDVELDFGDEIYLLHSDALKSGSRWFEKSLSDRWSQWKKDGESDFRYYYRVELDKDGDPYLASASKGTSCDSELSPAPTDISPNTDAVTSFVKTFKLLVNALYKEPITLCDAQSCIQLVELADEYDALVAVSPIIQIAILEWNEWVEALVCLPLEFLTLANKLESKILFKEALIHAVGRLVEDSETFSGCEKGLPIETRCLLTDEIVALQRRIQRITYELLSLQVLEPSSRWDNETRLTAMMFWATLGGIIREAESGTTNHARLFRKIHNHRFLTDSQLMNNSNQFSRPKIQSCFDIMVPAVKSRVSEFTKDCTTFTVGQELDYLTCIEVSDDKLPWMKRRHERLANRIIG